MIRHLRLLALALYAGTIVIGHEATASRKRDCPLPNLIDATFDELHTGLENECFTSVDLVNAYIHRIDDVNSTVHTILELNPDALDIAEQLDQEREMGNLRGPLHGLPVLVKDNIGTGDEMQTAAGSYALVGAKVDDDSTVVARLREQGLVILGKTSLSEWANIRSMNSSNGWNARGGQTYGAYYLNQDPNGSSSGSAVATDLGLAFAALGTETSGSILFPSEVNNIVGIKPTVGLTSRHLVIPVSPRQDTVGPMARTVKDAALLLQAMAGSDPYDNYTQASPYGSSPPDYAAACQLSGLQGKRIGIPENVLSTLTGNFTPMATAFNAAVSVMAQAGATIVHDANFTAYEQYIADQTTTQAVLAIDFISSIPKYLATNLTANPHNLHNISDIRTFTQQEPLEEYPSRDTQIWDIAIATGLSSTSPEFWAMYQKSLYYGGEGGLLGALSRHNLDAIILPTGVAAGVPAMVGAPVITVPMGAFPDSSPIEYNSRGDMVYIAPGIPFGISFLGKQWSETVLIGMAYAFEQKTLVRKTLKRVVEPKGQLSDVIDEEDEEEGQDDHQGCGL
ncbi:putative amidase [Aspergillus steynii IBT 23096]|uniref:Putative amidase n=1 Tax=Aspergillus steynii IBT 23096 TaxID=1392250 RepID=A0A2I2G865_9EURO|nr:putative amidase [Aspergillus steynii IBT 23096]PLB49058.1 putative amidase [Aspergillus steynii IBT 23096]